VQAELAFPQNCAPEAQAAANEAVLPALAEPVSPSAAQQPTARREQHFEAALAAALVWRGRTPNAHTQLTLPTGHANLDAALPGGGWPLNSMCEWLIAGVGHGEWPLLAPALANISARGLPILLIEPPHMPYAPALVHAGVALSQLIVVQTGNAKAALWCAEQSLRAGCLGACVLWAAHADERSVRRLKLACDTHPGFSVILRAPEHALQPSSASLRLRISPNTTGVCVEFLKLRGARPGQRAQLPWPV
jgi:hypothetical protein